MWACDRVGMWRSRCGKLPAHVVEFLFGEANQGHATHRAEGPNRAVTNGFRHPRFGDVQQARQFARAQESEIAPEA